MKKKTKLILIRTIAACGVAALVLGALLPAFTGGY